MAIRDAVAILGAGVQGRRLAYMWSSRGSPVRLIDCNPFALKSALCDIEKLKITAGRASGHENGIIETFSSDELGSALKDAWLVVENVSERLQLKRTAIKQLDELASPKTVIASNSSSFTITEIVEGLKFRHLRCCVNLHSYWPPETPVIEIMGTDTTDPEIIPRLMIACKEHGFRPFHVKKNSTGYIYNRIWAAIKRESLFVAAEGVASPKEIDDIYKDVLKTPMGPFEQMDVVGLDVALAIEEHYAECRNGLPTQPRELLGQMIQQRKLGVKSGEGFYKY